MSFYQHFLVSKVPVYLQVIEADGWSYGRTKLAVQSSLDFHDRGETAKIEALTRIGKHLWKRLTGRRNLQTSHMHLPKLPRSFSESQEIRRKLSSYLSFLGSAEPSFRLKSGRSAKTTNPAVTFDTKQTHISIISSQGLKDAATPSLIS